MSACYKIYSIVQRVFLLTVDSLLNPRTLSIAFVKLINYYAPKISNENPTYISYKWLKYTYFCFRYSFKPSWKTFSVKMCDIIRITDAAAKIWIHIRDWFLLIHDHYSVAIIYVYYSLFKTCICKQYLDFFQDQMIYICICILFVFFFSFSFVNCIVIKHCKREILKILFNLSISHVKKCFTKWVAYVSYVSFKNVE